MKNPRKTEFILELERDTPSPLQEMLTPEAIKRRSELALSEANPELLRIANDNFLTLKYDWDEIVRIYDAQNLNR